MNKAEFWSEWRSSLTDVSRVAGCVVKAKSVPHARMEASCQDTDDWCSLVTGTIASQSLDKISGKLTE